jgi:hypothetical protein
MKLSQNENAQANPIEIMFTVMLTVIIMSLLLLVFGSYLDVFMNALGNLLITMPMQTAWGTSMMAALPYRYASFFFLVPGFFTLLVIVWGFKNLIVKRYYTKTDLQSQQMGNGEEF